jgi:hypothetical protein
MAAFTGGEKLKAKLQEIAAKLDSAKSVQVGFLSGTTEDDGTSLPMIAAIQEFGAPKAGIPPRPFMRPAFAKHSGKWAAGLSGALKAFDYDAKKALSGAGDVIKGQVQDSIKSVTTPPLSPVTLLLRDRFGNNRHEITFADVQKARADVAAGVVPNMTPTQGKPLIWTGQMWNKVDYEVKY